MNKDIKKSLQSVTQILSIILITTTCMLALAIISKKDLSASVSTPPSSVITLTVKLDINGNIALSGDGLPEIKSSVTHTGVTSESVYENILGKLDTSSNLLVAIIENKDATITETVYEINKSFAVNITNNEYIQRSNSVGSGNVVLLLIPPSLEVFITSQPSEISECHITNETKIVVEKKAYVCISQALILRTAPNENAEEITILTPDTTFTVIEGPSCSNNSNWWRVRTINGFSGWVKEGDENGAFICPVLDVDEIIIGSWKIVKPKCENITRPWVELIGVEIQGGVPPYRITISQENNYFYDLIIGNNFEDLVIFDSPVRLYTGTFVEVTIESYTINGKPSWQDQLLFPYFDPTCVSNE